MQRLLVLRTRCGPIRTMMMLIIINIIIDDSTGATIVTQSVSAEVLEYTSVTCTHWEKGACTLGGTACSPVTPAGKSRAP
jgi:hypothetical protein